MYVHVRTDPRVFDSKIYFHFKIYLYYIVHYLTCTYVVVPVHTSTSTSVLYLYGVLHVLYRYIWSL